MKIELDMYQTLALAVLVLMLGKFLRERVRLLDKFCIPAPVIGGVLFAIFTCICYVTGVAEFAFDDTLKEVCMVMFFTSVGFQANLKVLKSGGKAMIVFLGVVIVLIVSQNFLAVGLANLLGVDPLVGLCTGSIPMVGGHGTAGAFGPVLEDFGIKGATTLCTAAATYGLIAGSMMGGPLGKMLIERHHLLDTIVPEDDSLLVEEEIKHERHSSMYPAASFQLIIAMGRDYDAAVIVSGTCGFGMGATPNAMANMQAVCDKYSPSVKAYLLIPLVGSLFADFINSLVITVFINFI